MGKLIFLNVHIYMEISKETLVAMGGTEERSKGFERASRANCLGVRTPIFPAHETVVIKTMPVYKKVVNDRGAGAE